MRVPAAFGGDGVSQKQLFQLLIELAKADSNVVQALRGHFAFAEDRLNAHKTEAQNLWFQRFAQGEIAGNAWTEIGTVEIGDVATRVTETQQGQLVVNGQKYYATGTLFADWIDLSPWMKPPVSMSLRLFLRRLPAFKQLMTGTVLARKPQAAAQ